jgi:hypothetical protein
MEQMARWSITRGHVCWRKDYDGIFKKSGLPTFLRNGAVPVGCRNRELSQPKADHPLGEIENFFTPTIYPASHSPPSGSFPIFQDVHHVHQ